MRRYPTLDRIFFRATNVIAVAYLVAAPVALLSYGWMGKLVVEAAGWWAVPILLSHIIVFVGLAHLYDIQSGHYSHLERDQRQPPEPR
jgi:hypothetical protein